MNVLPIRNRSMVSATAADRQDSGRLQPVGRFAEMCMIMCLGAVAMSLLFFGAAGRLGYTDMFQQYPELSVLALAINLSLPMAVWMRFRAMDWRPTLEMSGSTMLAVMLARFGLYPGHHAHQPHPV